MEAAWAETVTISSRARRPSSMASSTSSSVMTFGDAGGLQLVVGVLFIEDGAGFLLHQHRSGGVHRGRAADGLGGEDQKRGGQQGRSQFFS